MHAGVRKPFLLQILHQFKAMLGMPEPPPQLQSQRGPQPASASATASATPALKSVTQSVRGDAEAADRSSLTLVKLLSRVVHTMGPGPKFGPLADFFWALKV